jgi:hypothetical protein
VTIAILAAVAIAVGAVIYTLTRGGSAGAGEVSVQASASSKQAVAALLKLRYAGQVVRSSGSDCSQGSTGDVKTFFAKNPCKEYAITSMEVHDQKVSTRAVISWVVMNTTGLTAQYRNLVDELHKGNPPGQPASFNGSCYASGQDGNSTWVAQVQPTGNVAADRQILQAVAPAKLPAGYLPVHCVG